MNHRRLDIARMALDDIDVPLAYGDVLIVERDNTPDLDWECVVMSLHERPVDPAAYRLGLDLFGGHHVHGDAILVRSSDRMHVFRGAGPLHGARTLLHD